MEPPSLPPSFPPPAPPLDDWVVALCVVAVGAAVLCLGCALQVRSKGNGASRVAASYKYNPRRDPTLVRTLECMLSCLSRHATSPDVVMQAVDALHANRHLLIPVAQLVLKWRQPSVAWQATTPERGGGSPRRPREGTVQFFSERPRREDLPRCLPCTLGTI